MAAPKIKAAEFVMSVHRTEQLPRGPLPEVAFLGRSNVGKSSLMNALLGRKNLVRVSATPGCTRALNFFLINEKWYFVDLPGYGYARVSRGLKAAWGALIMDYLETREALKAVVFLQDPRRTPEEEELFLWETLKAGGRKVIPVLTKADKLKMGQRPQRLKEIAAALAPHGVAKEDLLWFSALTGEGRDWLWRRLQQLL